MALEDEEFEMEMIYLMLEELRLQISFMLIMFYMMIYLVLARHYQKYVLRDRTFTRNETRLEYLDSIIHGGDRQCINEIRMDRNTFGLLCELLRTQGRLKAIGTVTVEEQVCMFLHILAHHVKNRTISNRFRRSGQTVSRYVNSVLLSMLRLEGLLLRTADPVLEDCTDERWKWFKNCLGALDGTHIRVHVLEDDKPRYRTRKGEIATNVLGVCARDMKFTYVLPGWEGSASDSRVLRDAVTREHGLRIPTGYYYLVDSGYTNGQGFLAPYRGTRYHLSEWREGCAPMNHEEYFNMKHSAARNVIERSFGLLKKRWAILRSPSFYPIKTQGRIIIACCLLHNFIRREMSQDPIEEDLGDVDVTETATATEVDGETISVVESSTEWTNWRDNLAMQMYNEFTANRGNG